MTLELSLHLEGRRRKQRPAFGIVSRAAARALASRRLTPLVEALGSCDDPVEDVLFACRIHGISGLLDALAEKDGVRLPDVLATALREDRARIAERGARLAEELARLGDLAARSGLPFVPLKGSFLAPARYGDVSLRPCADLDLLAAGETFEAWSRLLVEDGYRLQTVGAKDSVFARPGARTPDSFEEHPDNPRPVELHRRLETRLLGRSLDVTDAYRAGLSEARLHGAPALLPSDRALALHLLVHAAPDLVGRGLRLVQFHDFRLLSPDAGLVPAAAELLGEAAWGIAALLAAWMPDALPEHVLEGLARHAPPARRRRAWLARPGLLTGAEERTLLVLAEAPLCRGPAELARRLAQAVPERSFLERAYGSRDGGVARLVRYYRDRFRA